MNSYKQIHRKDLIPYFKAKTVSVVLGTPIVDDDAPPPEPTIQYRDLIAGEDLSSWKDQPIRIGTDGKAYKANSILTNWNRVNGILSIPNTNGNQVRVQTSGLYQSSSYDWSASDIGDELVVRAAGISSDVLVATYGSEVMHIHIANVIDENTIQILSQPLYKYYL
jgi:hypothetical protein